VSANVECTIKQWSKTFCATHIGYRQAQIDAGADPGGAIAPPKIYERIVFHHDFVQFGKQHSRYKAVLPSVVLSQQCCEVYLISLTVVNV